MVKVNFRAESIQPKTAYSAVTQQNSNQNKQAEQTIKQGVQSPIVQQSASTAVAQNLNGQSSSIQTSKTISYVSGAIALAALGFGIAEHKNIKNSLNRVKNELGLELNKFTTEAAAKQKELSNKITEDVTASAEKSKKDIKTEFTNLEKKINTSLEEARLNSKIEIINPSKAQICDFPTRTVNVNNFGIALSSVIKPIEEPNVRRNFEQELRSESTKRIFGLIPKTKTPVESPMLRMVSVELKPFTSVGGLAVVPKDLTEELPKVLNRKDDATFVLDTIMHTGRVGVENGQEVSWKLVEDKANKTFEYCKFKDGVKVKKDSLFVNKLDELDVPIVGQKDPEHVRIFRAELDGKKLPFENVEHLFDKETLGEIDKGITTLSEEDKNAGIPAFETNNYKIIITPDDKKLFIPKLHYNLWDNKRFALDTPLDRGAQMYSETNISSGLTERYILFNKYIYEHMVNMEDHYADRAIKDKAGNVLLKTDGFILNDWHTGPLAAMVRLNTVGKKYYGKIEKDTADKIKNLPIESIMNNAKYGGETWHDQGRFLNIMFDEPAAEIVENSYAPNLSSIGKGIPGNLLSPLMNDKAISPMNMLLQYSDVIAPVSKTYTNEIARNEFFSGSYKDIYQIRLKEDAIKDPEGYKKAITGVAYKNDVNMDGVTDEAILKPTLRGRNNGLNKADNILTKEEIKEHKGLDDKEFTDYKFNELLPYQDFKTPEEAYNWKMHNKKIAIKYYVDSINAAKTHNSKDGKLNAWLGDVTDLTGVTEKTPVFATAGRIDPQKGYKLFLNSIVEYVTKYHRQGEEFPVFHIQGGPINDEYSLSVIKDIADTKEMLTKLGYKEAADRIVFLDRGDAFKYTISKLVTDHPIMSSIFEPCGLTHKEFMNKSGGVSVGNNTGGILADLEDGKDIYAVEYEPNPTGEATLPDGRKVPNTPEIYEKNIENFAKGIHRAYDDFRDPKSFAQKVLKSIQDDFTWTRENGTAFEYINDLEDIGALKRKN
jgi:glycogen synthase